MRKSYVCLIALCLAGCGPESQHVLPGETGSPTDGDLDADSDVDGDIDSDADTEPDEGECQCPPYEPCEACQDGEPCNGAEVCTELRTCSHGAALADDTRCLVDDLEGACVAQVCTPCQDNDGDGYIASGRCDGMDCNDSDFGTNPGADEVCDGIDDDDDDEADEDAARDAPSWYPDEDEDGYGDPEGEVVRACTRPEGMVSNDEDCDDDDPSFHPGADEADCTDPRDLDCDGEVGYSDRDGDGFAACEECDDRDPNVNPRAREVCDGIDNDCDGEVDEHFPDAGMTCHVGVGA